MYLNARDCADQPKLILLGSSSGLNMVYRVNSAGHVSKCMMYCACRSCKHYHGCSSLMSILQSIKCWPCSHLHHYISFKTGYSGRIGCEVVLWTINRELATNRMRHEMEEVNVIKATNSSLLFSWFRILFSLKCISHKNKDFPSEASVADPGLKNERLQKPM